MDSIDTRSTSAGEDSTCCILDSLGKQVGENREIDSR
jgi:hypothetical protein